MTERLRAIREEAIRLGMTFEPLTLTASETSKALRAFGYAA